MFIMRNTTTSAFLILFCSLALTGCVSREQADEQLVKGCLAGVGALLPEGRTVGAIKDRKITESPEGPDFRHIALTVAEADGWLENEVQYECIFQEAFGFLNASHTGSIYQIRFDNQVYGKSGNEILGTAEDFIKLNDAIRKAMYE